MADVFSTNPLSADSDHKYTCTGKEDDGSIGVEGISTTNATIPININGAVSPNACANPIIVPDNVPGKAKGTTWWKTDWNLDAPTAVGASKFQSVFHHVVPLALPGTLSGTIIGLAQALGETAPLILIGMVAFVVDIPSTPIDPSSSLPVQVYLWSESAERGFVEKTSATIMMLLSFLIVMNFLAVYLRQKFEKRWN